MLLMVRVSTKPVGIITEIVGELPVKLTDKSVVLSIVI